MMKKLNKRQVIIMAIAALFVLYAVYELLIVPSSARKNKKDVKPAEAASFVDAINSDLMKNKLVGVDTYIAGKAEIDWGRSPFLDKASYRELVGKDARSSVASKVVYSGYVDTGRKKMAIINGWEYEAGEPLELEGFVLKSVTPSKVVIVNPKNGDEVSVPIQE